LADTALEARRDPVLCGFFGIFGVPDGAPITGLETGRKRRK